MLIVPKSEENIFGACNPIKQDIVIQFLYFLKKSLSEIGEDIGNILVLINI